MIRAHILRFTAVLMAALTMADSVPLSFAAYHAATPPKNARASFAVQTLAGSLGLGGRQNLLEKTNLKKEMARWTAPFYLSPDKQFAGDLRSRVMLWSLAGLGTLSLTLGCLDALGIMTIAPASLFQMAGVPLLAARNPFRQPIGSSRLARVPTGRIEDFQRHIHELARGNLLLLGRSPADENVRSLARAAPRYLARLMIQLREASGRSEAEVREEIQRLLGHEWNVRFLEKMIRPESQGGLAMSEQALRKIIWEELMVYSFGGMSGFKKSRVRVKERFTEHAARALQESGSHFYLSSRRLDKNGMLRIGGYATRFAAFKKAAYVLEVMRMPGKDELQPVRIWFPKYGVGFRFLRVMELPPDPAKALSISNLPVLRMHTGTLTREQLSDFGKRGRRILIEWDLALDGTLHMAGGRKWLNGKYPPATASLSQAFYGQDYADERVFVPAEAGNVHGCWSVDSPLREDFTIMKKKGREIATLSGGALAPKELGMIGHDYETVHAQLSPHRGSLDMGGQKDLIVFDGRRFGSKFSHVYQWLRTHKKKLLAVGALIVEDGKVVTGKTNKLIYDLTHAVDENLFKRHRKYLYDSFDYYVSQEKLMRGKRHEQLRSYVVAGDSLRLRKNGSLKVFKKVWGYFERVAVLHAPPQPSHMNLVGALVEVAVLHDGQSNESRGIRFLRDKEGNPFWDEDGNPPGLQVYPKSQANWEWPVILDSSWVVTLRQLIAYEFWDAHAGAWENFMLLLRRLLKAQVIPRNRVRQLKTLYDHIESVILTRRFLQNEENEEERQRLISHIYAEIAASYRVGAAFLRKIDKVSAPAIRPWREVAREKYPVRRQAVRRAV